MTTPQPATASERAATTRLAAAMRTGRRAALHPQRLYQRNVSRLCPGRVLDLGCGVGRHLANLAPTSVGIDSNAVSVAFARKRGLSAFTPDEFASSGQAETASFDALLCSHVLEHLTFDGAVELVARHLPYVRPGGRVVAICPQQRGQRADPTHVTPMPAERLAAVLAGAGAVVDQVRSFPLPALAGRWFTHNETIVVAHAPGRP